MRTPTDGIWAFDFDGTLSHLVPDRNAAALDTECEALLKDLADDPDKVVAVVSSRSLEDLQLRVSISNVILAGASGLEWCLPGGEWLGPNQQAKERLLTERKRLLPALAAVERIPGIEIEDKTWSATVHFRKVAVENRDLVTRALENLRIRHGVSLHYGPEAAEIQFLQEVSKEIAVKTLVKLFAAGLTGRRFVYAGDDQNDAQAMRWVLDKGGVVYIVGSRISLAGARVVSDPTALARAIRRRVRSANARSHHRNERVVNE